MTPEEAFDFLKRSREAGRMAHAYLFEGAPRGPAGALAARVLGLLFCEGSARPCGRCRACGWLARRAHPDVLWVEPEMKSRIISVDQVRALQHRIFQTAYGGGWKACVVSAADRLGPEAANAFLKTLEEPPPESVFFLLSDSPQHLLPTVLSRCQRLSVQGEAPGPPAAWLAEILDIASSGPGGYAVTALAKADRLARLLKAVKEVVEKEEQERARTRAEIGAPEDDDVVNARSSARYREARAGLMGALLAWYRDVLAAACGAGAGALLYADRAEQAVQAARGLTYRQALENVRAVMRMHRRLEGNVPEGPVLAAEFSRIT